MSEPMLPEPASAPNTAQVDGAIGQLVADPSRLGLTWDLRLATIGTLTPTITATVDGDDKAITVYNMMETAVAIGDRVYVVSVPPGGNFICGRANLINFFTRTSVSGATGTMMVNVPSNLREVEIGWTARSDASPGGGAQSVEVAMRINSISTGDYFTQLTVGNGGSTASGLRSFQTEGFVGHGCNGNISDVYGSGKIWFQGWDMPIRKPWTFTSAALCGGGLQDTGGGFLNVAPFPGGTISLFMSAGNFITGSTMYARGTYS